MKITAASSTWDRAAHRGDGGGVASNRCSHYTPGGMIGQAVDPRTCECDLMEDTVQFPNEAVADVTKRLSRAEGQIRGIRRMLDDGADCRDVVVQLAAAKAALERAGVRLMTAGMRQCIESPESDVGTAEMERLFLKLS